MKSITLSRRTLLAAACRISGATALAVIGACAQKKPATACVNTDRLGDSERSLRASLQYTDQSPDPAKACGGCAYFRATAAGAQCGDCQILSGPVDARGHCSSWSAKS